jgi:hypothetical protein
MSSYDAWKLMDPDEYDTRFGRRDEPDEPEPELCSCGAESVGYNDGVPSCAACYRNRPAFFDPTPKPDPKAA